MKYSKKLHDTLVKSNYYDSNIINALLDEIERLQSDLVRLTADRDGMAEENRMLSERLQRQIDGNVHLSAELARLRGALERIAKCEVAYNSGHDCDMLKDGYEWIDTYDVLDIAKEALK